MSDDDNLDYRFQNLHEFVKVARQNLNRNNWDYLIGASESETTLARNRLALDSIGFRPRVLRDVSNVDCSRRFSAEIAHPGAVRAGRLAGEFRAGRRRHGRGGDREFGNGMILSSVSHPGLEKTAEAARRRVPRIPALCARRRGWVDDHVRARDG